MYNKDEANSSKISKTGKILLALTGGIGIGITVVCASFVSPALRKHCLPYVPATTKQINNILQSIRKRDGNLLDIGSGDGRIVIAAAKNGFTAHGVELNPWLVLYSQWSAFRNGVSKVTNFYRRDLWKFSISPYKNIVIFGVEEMMLDIENKISKEATDNTFVIACRFPLPSMVPDKILGEGIDTVWTYKLKKKKAFEIR